MISEAKRAGVASIRAVWLRYPSDSKRRFTIDGPQIGKLSRKKSIFSTGLSCRYKDWINCNT